jgi:transcriptional regulator
MHPNRKFHIESRDEMAALVRALGFGIVVAPTEQGLRAVHVPLRLEGERLLFHVSRGNQVHSALAAGCEALCVVNGAHAYVSPDDYGMEGRVPTWSYVAIELNGPVRPLGEDALVGLLDAMSADNEARLAPRPPWTRDQLPAGRFEAMVKAIAGFEMEIADWRGTAKIDQDKPDEVRARVADALQSRGEDDLASLYARPYPGSSV